MEIDVSIYHQAFLMKGIPIWTNTWSTESIIKISYSSPGQWPFRVRHPSYSASWCLPLLPKVNQARSWEKLFTCKFVKVLGISCPPKDASYESENMAETMARKQLRPKTWYKAGDFISPKTWRWPLTPSVRRLPSRCNNQLGSMLGTRSRRYKLKQARPRFEHQLLNHPISSSAPNPRINKCRPVLIGGNGAILAAQ